VLPKQRKGNNPDERAAVFREAIVMHGAMPLYYT
jgi:hypothetical protein